MAKHQVHRKQTIAKRTIRSRRFWRWFVKLNKLVLELGIEVSHYKN